MTFAFGAFLGPSISGVLYDNYGIGDSTYFVIVLQFCVATIYLIFCLRHRKPKDIESKNDVPQSRF
jgi:hypothetical protein